MRPHSILPWLLLCIISPSLRAAPEFVTGLLPIPREPARQFENHGLFEGGTDTRVNVESLRLAPHQDELTGTPFERWVIDFSSVGKRELDVAAPRFQLRYERAERFLMPNGEDYVKRPARFLLLFEAVQDCFLSPGRLKQLVKKSRFVKNIVLYPQIENGDMVLELDLKNDLLFEAHQPREKEGRLVLDLKSAEVRLP